MLQKPSLPCVAAYWYHFLMSVSSFLGGATTEPSDGMAELLGKPRCVLLSPSGEVVLPASLTRALTQTLASGLRALSILLSQISSTCTLDSPSPEGKICW